MREKLKILGITTSIISSIGSLMTFNDNSRIFFMEKFFGITETRKLTDVEIEKLKQQAEKAQLETKIAQLETDKFKIKQEKIEAELKLKDQINIEHLQNKIEVKIPNSTIITNQLQQKEIINKNFEINSSIKSDEKNFITTKNASLYSDDECYNLWYRRNLIYAENGYCFTSNLGKEVFKNFHCITTQHNLSNQDKIKIDNIKIQEDKLSCNINVNVTHELVFDLVEQSKQILTILSLAMDNGGVNHEHEIQQIVSQSMYPINTKSSDKKLARNLNDKGHYFLKNDDIQNAIEMFKQAHIANPYDIEITNNLGFANMKAGKLDAAEKYLIETLILSPTRATAWSNLGDVYGLENEGDKAIACYANMYRFSKDRINTDQFMKKINSDENIESLKILRGKAIRLAHDWFLF